MAVGRGTSSPQTEALGRPRGVVASVDEAARTLGAVWAAAADGVSRLAAEDIT